MMMEALLAALSSMISSKSAQVWLSMPAVLDSKDPSGTETRYINSRKTVGNRTSAADGDAPKNRDMYKKQPFLYISA